ncbi:cytochrome P450 [Colletotrichum gloeosporioides Cg-14]|uniref:Cytochrome P450 n=1 Tax=Colletotrichum gloeosporioides (strain Cg-14) TaxID=1237896 RepID=T0K974_COLGC|nr:cytochrome P450 [Colletotrichum gloeosporioides Cg-14]
MSFVMHSSLLLSSASISVLVLLFLVLRRVCFSPLARLPGTQFSKWTDLPLKYHWLSGTRSAYVQGLHDRYGPIVRLGPSEVSVTDGTAVKQIYNVKSGFAKSAFYRRLDPGPESIFNTSDVDFSRRHRRLLTSPLSESSLKALEPLVDDRIKLAIERIRQEMKIRHAADIAKFWLFMATDVISELSFGESFGMLEKGEKNQYISDLENLSKLGGVRALFPTLVSWASVIPVRPFTNSTEAALRMGQYATDAINRYKSYAAKNPTNQRPMLLSKMFKAGEEGLSSIEIESDAQAYIIAGSDTTANTLTYLIWAVSQDKRIKDKLCAEIAQLDEDFSDTDLHDLPYLNQVIQEALRVFPAVPATLPRTVPSGGTTLCGYWIPSGTTVVKIG